MKSHGNGVDAGRVYISRLIRRSIAVPLPIEGASPTLIIKRTKYEEAGLTRAAIDQRLNLTAEDFRVEGDLVAVGPIVDTAGELLPRFIEELEGLGLVYFDDFFELTGNWPEWLRIYAGSG